MSTPYDEVIGDPVAHSKSPLIHKFWLEKLGMAGDYRRCHVRAEGLADYFAKRRADPYWRGCNVTIPHKQAVVGLVDQIDRQAWRIGASNTVVEIKGDLCGYNTDAGGFLASVGPLTYDADDCCGMAIVIGAGGAARAIVLALYDAGFQVDVVNRDVARALQLARDIAGESAALIGTSPLFNSSPLLFEVRKARAGETNLLVNATSLGMRGQPPLPIELTRVSPAVTVYDIVYDPLETPLLREAKARGHRTIDGLQMLVGQAAAAFELFFGAPAPREHDAELRALLVA